MRSTDARRARFDVCLGSGAVLLAVALILPVSLSLLLPLMVGGGLLGAALGRRRWRRQLEELGPKNLLVVYYSDSPFFLLLLGLGVLRLFPRAAVSVGARAAQFPEVSSYLLVLVAATWFAYDLRLYLLVRRYENENGPLRIRSFYARSQTGQEALLGRRATVVRSCDPTGKVRLGSELWMARSITGEALLVGANVLVRDVHGLTLEVEATDASR